LKLAWTYDARSDRRAIFAYIENDNPQAALRLDEQFSKRAAQLVSHPMIGRIGRVDGTRELVVRPNYILIYDLAGEIVRILRILHAAQQWPAGEE
jgi:addiction module RelE/StbE family toxin